jgi:hypothetical protein
VEDVTVAMDPVTTNKFLAQESSAKK